MSRAIKIVGVAACGLIVLACYVIGQSQEDDITSPQREQGRPLFAHQNGVDSRSPKLSSMLGAASCAGTHCHGGPIPDPVAKTAWATNSEPTRWQSSFTVWRAYDPHARAYAVLLEPKSQEIARTLWGPNGKKAHEDSRCLVCHATPSIVHRTDLLGRALQTEGVSCEACHGNSAGWIGRHDGWAPGPGHSDRYGPAGMTNLADIVVRAETCARCHVGSPAVKGIEARDMNHDMIAAGHPRLNFDYATYVRALPPHWTETDRQVAPPRMRSASEAFSQWLVGRAVTTAASLRLLALRTSAGQWPELAECNCYACHRSLSDHPRTAASTLGSLTWNEPPLLPPLTKLAGNDPLESNAHRVRTLLQMSPTDQVAIGQEATKAAGQWLTTARLWAKEPPSLQEVVSQLAEFTPNRWDDACHLYYALQIVSAYRRGEEPRYEKLRDELRLPRQLGGRNFNSPADFDGEKLKPRFAELFRLHVR